MKETSQNSSGRIPPQDLEAEKSLLGAILLDDTRFPDVLEQIQDTSFYDPSHQMIFRAMMSIYDRNHPIDLMTLRSALQSDKTLSKIGGTSYLAELTNFVPTASHIGAYTDLVAQAALRRRLIQAGTEIAAKAYDSEANIGELVGSAEKELFSVSDQTVKSSYSTLSELLPDAYQRIEELSKSKGALRGLRTGFRDLDKKTAGLQRGDLIIIGARPAMGKTTFAQNLAYNIATHNGDKSGVLFYSMEMARSEIVDRLVSDTSGVDSWKIRSGNITEEDFAKIGDALGEMEDIPFYIDDSSSMTILELRNKARRAAHEHNINLIIVDYLQLINGSDRYAGNRVQEVTEISRGLKTLARELNIPVVALAQLSRNVTGRDDPRPVLSDLRESGSIEQDADIVAFLHRPDYYRQNDENYIPTNITELILAKHRHGPVGTIKLFFDSQHLRFMTLDQESTED